MKRGKTRKRKRTAFKGKANRLPDDRLCPKSNATQEATDEGYKRPGMVLPQPLGDSAQPRTHQRTQTRQTTVRKAATQERQEGGESMTTDAGQAFNIISQLGEDKRKERQTDEPSRMFNSGYLAGYRAGIQEGLRLGVQEVQSGIDRATVEAGRQLQRILDRPRPAGGGQRNDDDLSPDDGGFAYTARGGLRLATTGSALIAEYASPLPPGYHTTRTRQAHRASLGKARVIVPAAQSNASLKPLGNFQLSSTKVQSRRAQRRRT